MVITFAFEAKITGSNPVGPANFGVKMTITEFIRQLERFQYEVGCNGEQIGSHSIKSKVKFFLGDKELYIKEYDLTNLVCGCPCDLWLEFTDET